MLLFWAIRSHEPSTLTRLPSNGRLKSDELGDADSTKKLLKVVKILKNYIMIWSKMALNFEFDLLCVHFVRLQ